MLHVTPRYTYYRKLFKIPSVSNANGVSASKGRELGVILFVILGN